MVLALIIVLQYLCAEIVDRDGKSSLLSLVKAFDSVLAVYEGFCNLKQVSKVSILCLFLYIFIYKFRELQIQ